MSSKPQFNANARDKNSGYILHIRETLRDPIKLIIPEFISGEGLISEATEEAFRIAKAAEGAYQLAGATNHLLSGRTEQITKQIALKAPLGKSIRLKDSKNPGGQDYIVRVLSPAGPAFDPAATHKSTLLNAAQATHIMGQWLFNREVAAMNKEINAPQEYFERRGSANLPQIINGLKIAAVYYYGQAADLLEKEGHKDAARKIRDVATALAERHSRREKVPTPHESIAKFLLKANAGDVELQADAKMLGKLGVLTAGQLHHEIAKPPAPPQNKPAA